MVCNKKVKLHRVTKYDKPEKVCIFNSIEKLFIFRAISHEAGKIWYKFSIIPRDTYIIDLYNKEFLEILILFICIIKDTMDSSCD